MPNSLGVLPDHIFDGRPRVEIHAEDAIAHDPEYQSATHWVRHNLSRVACQKKDAEAFSGLLALNSDEGLFVLTVPYHKALPTTAFRVHD